MGKNAKKGVVMANMVSGAVIMLVGIIVGSAITSVSNKKDQ